MLFSLSDISFFGVPFWAFLFVFLFWFIFRCAGWIPFPFDDSEHPDRSGNISSSSKEDDSFSGGSLPPV